MRTWTWTKGWIVSVIVGSSSAVGAVSDGANSQNHLQIPEPTTESLAVPNRGMSMNQVESSWGDPKVRVDPVGVPPITRWVYDGFTVYFEHNQVIHSVVNR